jgi:Domain of unknown function (DUF4440)
MAPRKVLTMNKVQPTCPVRSAVLFLVLTSAAVGCSPAHLMGQTAVVHATTGNDETVLAAHRTLWNTWFAGDSTGLMHLMTADFVALNAGEPMWSGRDSVVRASGVFIETGRVLAIDFPDCIERRWEMIAILFCTYVVDVEEGGRAWRTRGRSTEIFRMTETGWLAAGWHLEGK